MIPTDDQPPPPTGAQEPGEELTPADAAGGVDADAAESPEAKLRGERDYYLDQLQRARAELDNFRRRVQRDRQLERQRISVDLFRQVLPIYDDLLLAMTTDGVAGEGRLRDGLQLIADKFEQVLSDGRVEMVAAEGETFDPNLHEAMLQEETDQVPDGHILAVFERGYRLGDDLIRPARVKVAKAPSVEE